MDEDSVNGRSRGRGTLGVWGRLQSVMKSDYSGPQILVTSKYMYSSMSELAARPSG